MRYLRTMLSSLIVCLVAGTCSLTAVAADPAHKVFQDDRSLTDHTSCPFDIGVHLTATIHDRLFFDAAGNLERVHETVRHVTIEFTANGTTLVAKGTGGIDIRIAADGSTTGIVFENRGTHLLKGVPGEWPLFSVIV